MSAPYSYFGFNLWRRRERKGIRTVQIAEYLGMSVHEYKKFESGERIPSSQQLLDISKILDTDVGRLKRWIALGAMKGKGIETVASKEAIEFTKLLDDGLGKVESSYYSLSGKMLTKREKQILINLHKDLPRIYILPVLAMNYILIQDALTGAYAIKAKYLHEIKDFILTHESLAGYVCREIYFGPFIFYMANLILFQKNPCKSMLDCFNRLTLSEFEDLLWLAVFDKGLFDGEEDIPLLQQLSDFLGLAALMVRELQPSLPSNIDPDHLYQAVLLQGIGIYALYTNLKPALYGRGEEELDDDSENAMSPNPQLMERIIYELHAIVSAMIGANWNFPPQVLKTVLTHHHLPAKEVDPVCATLKLINFIVDNDFPDFSKKDLEDLLAQYPQITIPTESLFQVCVRLKQYKETLYERSSTVLEQTNKSVAKFNKEKIKRLSQPAYVMSYPKPVFPEPYLPPKKSEFRFDPGYQAVLLNNAYSRHENFTRRMMTPRNGESYRNFGERQVNFWFSLSYVTSKDIQSSAQKGKATVDEVQLRLFR